MSCLVTFLAIAGLAVAQSAPPGPAPPRLITVDLQTRAGPPNFRRVARYRNFNNVKSNALSSVGLQSWFVGTDLQYYGPVQIGTPPQTLMASFDTYGSDVMFPSTQCAANPGCTTHKLFDSKASSTFKSTDEQFQIDFTTGLGVAPSDNETVLGIISNDTVAIGGLAVQNQAIALVTDQTKGYGGTPFDGSVGLGPTGGSAAGAKPFLVSLMEAKQVDQPVFGFYTVPSRVGGGAQLTLGGVDPTKATGPLIPLAMNTVQVAKYQVFIANVDGVSVNGKPAGINGTAFFDTGTSNIFAPSNDDALRVYAMISPAIKLVDPAGGFAMPCNMVNTTAATIDFVMAGVNFRIPSEELSVGPYPGMAGMCQTVINGGGVGVPGLWTVGSTMLKYYYNAWDVQKVQLSLAKTAQSPKGGAEKAV